MAEVADEVRKSRRPGTLYGDRNENRARVITAPEGVDIVPAEFAESAQPITGVGMAPAQELVERVERARSATKSAEFNVTTKVVETAGETAKRLDQQDVAIADVKETVTTVQIDVAEVKSEVVEAKKDVATIKVDVAEMRGELKHLPKLVDAVQDAVRQVSQREHVKLTASVEVEKAEQLAEVQVDTAQKLDAIDARKQRRRLVLQVVGLLGAGGGLAELAHWLVTR